MSLALQKRTDVRVSVSVMQYSQVFRIVLPAIRASPCGGISALCAARHRWPRGSADHQLVGFLLGARRGKASLATGLSGPPTGGITGTCAAGGSKIFGVNPASTPPTLRLGRRRPGRIRNLHLHMIYLWISFQKYHHTYKTSLKADKEVGG